MRALAANTFLILIVLGIAFASVIGIARKDFSAPGPLAEDVIVTVPKGANLQEISEILAESGTLPESAALGVIDGAMLFRLGTQYPDRTRELKYGDYKIEAGASPEEILALIISGRSVPYFVTVAEGRTSWQVIETLNAHPALTGEIVEVPPEGSILPETYAVSRLEDRNAVLARMRDAMNQALDKAWEGRDPDLPLESKEQLLILASIVEKETRPDEHAKVASVFVNRLIKGMRLQTDPTVIYGITLGKGSLGRGLRRSELDRATPYNTYVIDGLPPTPIANPGVQSLEATANPAETPYLFFVADGTGGHAFAETLDEHNRNVAAWRKIEREQRQGN